MPIYVIFVTPARDFLLTYQPRRLKLQIMKMIVRINKFARFVGKFCACAWFLAAAAVLIGVSVSVVGQSKTDGAINGVVIDQNRAAIAGARVTATGRTVTSSTSDAYGEFSVPVAL